VISLLDSLKNHLDRGAIMESVEQEVRDARERDFLKNPGRK
jgi:hypothetical protein